MIRKYLGNTTLKKAGIFMVVFALTGVMMGDALLSVTDNILYQPVYAATLEQEAFRVKPAGANMEAAWEPEGGDYASFVQMVKKANGREADTGEDAFTFFTEREESFRSSGGFFHDTEAKVEMEVAVEENPGIGEAQFVYLPGIPLSEELQRFTYERCQEVGIEYELVLAIMWRESRFQVNAVGYNTNGTRDNGIMQINDVNRGWLRSEYGITDLMDPYQNITAGTAMLGEYISEYGDEKAALLAYHYGEAGMRRKAAQGVTTNKAVTIALDMRDTYKQMIQYA